MNLTSDQIRDYEACPRYYDFKYGDSPVPVKLNKRQKMSEEFMDTIKKVGNFYLYKKQSFNDPTLRSLYNRWQRDWYKDLEAADVAKMQNSVQQRSRTSFGTRAMDVIQVLYDDFKEVGGDEVFWLNEDYIVPISNQENVIEGTVDLVIREKKTNTFHIFKWTESNTPIQTHKYDLAAAEYAFRYRYDFKEMNTKHYVWHFYGQQLGRQEIKLEKKDFDLMGYYASEIQKDDIFAPKFGYSTYCKGCSFTTKCQKWNFPKTTGDK